ncbi:MAG: hypothetical protein HEP71_30860 [Roseivirga sp.]|nr:hypothetical protein [Roseivirga sp.]
MSDVALTISKITVTRTTAGTGSSGGTSGGTTTGNAGGDLGGTYPNPTLANSIATSVNFNAALLSGNSTFQGQPIADNYIVGAANWNQAYGWGNHANFGYLMAGDLAGYARVDEANDWTGEQRFRSSFTKFYSTGPGYTNRRLTINITTTGLAQFYNYDESLASFHSFEFGGTSTPDTGLGVNALGEVTVNALGSAASPALGFGNTGFYKHPANLLILTVNGSARFQWAYAGMSSVAGTGGAFINRLAATSTRPVWSFVGDEGTGVGRLSAGRMSFITNDSEIMRLNGSNPSDKSINVFGALRFGPTGGELTIANQTNNFLSSFSGAFYIDQGLAGQPIRIRNNGVTRIETTDLGTSVFGRLLVTERLTATDFISSTSYIQGDSFIKVGGTSTEFLKADGSVDSNTYALSGHNHDSQYEPLFSKNSAFNKNFGTVSGTVAQGNDSRILNGQTAYGWGDHAGLYLTSYTEVSDFNDVTNRGSVTGNNITVGDINATDGVFSTLAIGGSEVKINGTLNGVSFENDKHAITFNDGFGNFNIRVGNNGLDDEKCTEAGYIFNQQWSQSSGKILFRVSSLSLAVGDTPTWRNQIEINPSGVIVRYEGADRITTTSVGVSVNGDITGVTNITAGGDITGSNLNVSDWNTAYGWGDHAGLYALIGHDHSGIYEPVFSKNNAFNKSFGTVSGTVAQGNDSRILNGQTAYGWGDHASAGYATQSWVSSQGYITSADGGNADTLDGINSTGFAIWDTTPLSGSGSSITLAGQSAYDIGRVIYSNNNLSGGLPSSYTGIVSFKIDGDGRNFALVKGNDSTTDFWLGLANDTGLMTFRKLLHDGNLSNYVTKTYVDGLNVDADTLDNLTSSDFIRSNINDSVSANTEWQDNYQVRVGNGADGRYWHNGSNTYLDNITGNFYIRSQSHGGNIYLQGEDSGGTNRAMMYLYGGGAVNLYYNGSLRLATSSGGATVSGVLSATGGNSGQWNTAYGWGDHAGLYASISHNHSGVYEPVFSKNNAFNKNFGTVSGTVAQGNDSRILNGQTAYGWGDHANAGYVKTTDNGVRPETRYFTFTNSGSEWLKMAITVSTSDIYRVSGMIYVNNNNGASIQFKAGRGTSASSTPYGITDNRLPASTVMKYHDNHFTPENMAIAFDFRIRLDVGTSYLWVINLDTGRADLKDGAFEEGSGVAICRSYAIVEAIIEYIP